MLKSDSFNDSLVRRVKISLLQFVGRSLQDYSLLGRRLQGRFRISKSHCSSFSSSRRRVVSKLSFFGHFFLVNELSFPLVVSIKVLTSFFRRLKVLPQTSSLLGFFASKSSLLSFVVLRSSLPAFVVSKCRLNSSLL